MSVEENCEQQRMELEDFLNMEKYKESLKCMECMESEGPERFAFFVLEDAICKYVSNHIQESRKGNIKEKAKNDIFIKEPNQKIAKIFDEAFNSETTKKHITTIVGNCGYVPCRHPSYIDAIKVIKNDIKNGTGNFTGYTYTSQTSIMETPDALIDIIKNIFGEYFCEVQHKKFSLLEFDYGVILVDNCGFFYDTERERENRMILGPCFGYTSEKLLDDTVIIGAIGRYGIPQISERGIKEFADKKAETVVEKVVEQKPSETVAEKKFELSDKRFPGFDEVDLDKNKKKKVKFGMKAKQSIEEQTKPKVPEKIIEIPVEEQQVEEPVEVFGTDVFGLFQANFVKEAENRYIEAANKSIKKRNEELKKQQPKNFNDNHQQNCQWNRQGNRQWNRQRKSSKNPFDDFGGNRQRNPGKNPQKGNNNQKGFKQVAQEKQHKEQQEKKYQETIAKNAQRKVVEKPIEQKHIEQKPEKHVKWSVVNGSKEQPKKQVETVVETVVEKKVGNDEDWDYVEKQPEEQQVEEQQVEEPTINEIIMNELLEEDETIAEEQQVENQPTQQEQQQQEQQDEILDEKTLQESFQQALQESRKIFNENFGDEEMNAKACIATMSYFESLDFNELEAKFSKEDNLKGETVYDLLKH